MLIYLKKLIAIVFLLSLSIGFSQEKAQEKSNIPTSIYTSTKLPNNLNGILTINERLKLKSYKFMVLDEQSIEEGYFTVPLYNIYKSPTKYINDSYLKVYQTKNLKQAFFKVSDLYKVRAKNPF